MSIVKKRAGIILLMLIHAVLFLLIAGYVETACSTKIDNLFHVVYEPSGMQMLYYYFTAPIFVLLSGINYFCNKWLKIKKMYVISIVIIWLMFWIFIEFIDKFVHFPAGNELFYQGSLVIGLFSILLTSLSAYWQIYALLRKV